jgi:IS5 family transposase
VEHPFLDVKQIYGYAKVRYRGLGKNKERLALLLGLSNLRRAQSLLTT